MEQPSNHIALHDILSVLDNDAALLPMLEQLKQQENLSDELLGVKLFLEQNNYDVNELKLFLTTSSSAFDSLQTTSSNNFKQWLKMAAALLPIIGIAGYFYFSSPSQSEQLYQQYYEQELGLPVLLSINEDKVFNESMNLFRNEEYQKALAGFEQLLLANPENDTLNYFIGVGKLELSAHQQAEAFLSKNYTNSFFEGKAAYKLALLYIKTENTEKAKAILKEIAQNPDNTYSSSAKALLDSL